MGYSAEFGCFRSNDVVLHIKRWVPTTWVEETRLFLLGSDVKKDLGPKAKAKDLVPEATDPHRA